MKKLVLSAFIFFGISVPLLCAEEINLTLDEAVAIALRDNREIQLKAEDLKKAKLKIAETNASLYPNLTFTGSWTDTRGLYSKDLGQTTTQITLKEYLYKGGKIINTIKYNGYNFEVAQVVLDKIKLEVVFNVKKAFYTLLLANEFASLNKAILENRQQYLNFFQARYASGQASGSDLLKIQDALSSVQEAYTSSLNQVESAEQLLRNLLYLANDAKIEPQGEFGYEIKEVIYDEAFLKAMQTRPEIRQYEAQSKAAKKAIEIAKADSRPSIYASWDYYSRSHLSMATNKNWNDYNVIGLTFTWPIFDGWATKAKVEQAIVDLKEAQLVKEKTTKDIALELKNAYLDLKNAIAQIKSAQAQVLLYKDALCVTQKKYQAGNASSLDYDDATLGYQISLFNQKQSAYDYLLAKAQFDKATGGI